MRRLVAALTIAFSIVSAGCGRAPVPAESRDAAPSVAPATSPASTPAAAVHVADPERSRDLLQLLRTINPDVKHVSVVGSTSLPSGAELIVVVGHGDRASDLVELGPPAPSPAAEPEPSGPGFDFYDVLALVVRHGPGETKLIASIQDQEDGCCFGSVLKLTASEVVLAREGEKQDFKPIIKFFVEPSALHPTRVDFTRFKFLRRHDVPRATEFEFANGERVITIRPTSAAPFIEIASERQAIGEEMGRFPADLRVAKAIPGYTLPQTVPQTAGEDPAETIGPTAREGTKIWFGKTFYSMSDGHGGFGYFDTATRKSEVFAPPAIGGTSTSALLVEPDTIWLGLFTDAEWGRFAEGLLRVRRPSMETNTIDVDGLIYEFLRSAGRLYAVAENGVLIVAPDGNVEQWFIDVDANGTYQLSRRWAPRTTK